MAEKKTTKKTVKATEVKTLEQLNEEVAKLRADFDELRRSHRAGDLVNPRAITVKRKEIARALTAVKQAEIAASAPDLKEEK